MSEPDSPQWLDRVSEELRATVPVRGAWRARLLAQIADAPRPSTNDEDARVDDDALANEAVQAFASSRTSARSGQRATSGELRSIPTLRRASAEYRSTSRR